MNLNLHKSQSAKLLVGSARANNINYHRDTHAFDPALVSDKVKQAANEMRQLKTADVLGQRPATWNKSTYVDRMKAYSEQLLPTKQNFEIRTGLLDQQIPKPRPNKIYQGTETRDSFKNWNVSTYSSIAQTQKNLESMTAACRTSTAKVNQRLQGYIKPPLAQTQFVQKIRDDKRNDEKLREKIREQYLYECPKSSEEKTAAEVFKRINEVKLKVKQGEIASLNTDDETFKPRLSRNLSRRIESKRMHDGVWMYNEIVEKKVWSCCMNEDSNSPGCVIKHRNLDRWITITL